MPPLTFNSLWDLLRTLFYCAGVFCGSICGSSVGWWQKVKSPMLKVPWISIDCSHRIRKNNHDFLNSKWMRFSLKTKRFSAVKFWLLIALNIIAFWHSEELNFTTLEERWRLVIIMTVSLNFPANLVRKINCRLKTNEGRQKNSRKKIIRKLHFLF